MSRIIPFRSIPDSTTLPDGIFRFKVKKIEEGATKERDGVPSKFAYKLQAEVVEPASHKGLPYSETFTIGSNDDPDAELEQTWQTSFGARSLKKFAAKVGVPFGDEEGSESFCQAVTGQEYLATVVQKTEPAKRPNGEDNPFGGTVRNNVTAYWSIGEKQTELQSGTGLNGSAKTLNGASKTAAPASDKVKCTACGEAISRKDMKNHVDGHMIDMQKQTARQGQSTSDE